MFDKRMKRQVNLKRFKLDKKKQQMGNGAYYVNVLLNVLFYVSIYECYFRDCANKKRGTRVKE